MIEFENVSFKYDENLNSLNDINLQISNGVKLALTGDNAYDSKNIFFKILTGLEKNYVGDVYIDLKNVKKIDFSNDIYFGYVPVEVPFLNHKTVYKNLKYIYDIRGITGYEEKIEKALDFFGLTSFKDMKINKLSYFEKYLVALCRVYLRNLDYLVVENIFQNVTNDEIVTLANYIMAIIEENPELTLIIDTDNKMLIEKMNLSVAKIENGEILLVEE